MYTGQEATDMDYGFGIVLRRGWLRTAVTLLALFGMVVGTIGSTAAAEGSTTSPEKRKVPQVTVTLGERTILADVANTDQSRTEGLLGWESITEDRGMLLDFGVEREYAIHMQGMKFPIDALWVDSAGEIKLIYHDIRPDSGEIYPSMFPCTYCLEIKAGFCKKYGIEIGRMIRFGTR